MKYVLKVISLYLLPLGAAALPSLDFDNKYYVGATYAIKAFNFERSQGQSLLDNKTNQFQLDVGWLVKEGVMVEASYFTANSAIHRREWGAFNELGIVDPSPNTTETVLSKTNLNGVRLGLLGVYQFQTQYDIKLLGRIGLNYSRIKSTVELESHANFAGQFLVLQVDRDRINATFSKNLLYPSFGLGAQLRLTENLSMRVMADWEKTSRVTINASTTTSAYTVKMKDAIIPSLGLTYSI